jgi:kinetochore protein Mis13/DSN1
MFMLWISFACTVVDGSCRSKAEDQAWVEVSQFYNSYKENSESASRRQPLISAKAKGKQRATDAELWSAIGRELPPQFQGRKGVDMALRLIEEGSTCAGSSTKLKERLADMEMKVCLVRSRTLSFRLTCSYVQLGRLNQRSRGTLRCICTVEDELDRRFADLNMAITSTHVLPPIPDDTLPPRLLHIPHGSTPHPVVTDPQDVLRALSRIDMQRPPAQVGDSARRAAREAQRANESSNVERKLTGIPNTPRKAPGTPRRAGTPGRR